MIIRSHVDALRTILVVVFSLGFVSAGAAQQRSGDDNPVRPSISQTTQKNPRGTDIVEPMPVYLVTRGSVASPDSTLLGVAKIPDPKKSEIGAVTSRDLETGTVIRLGDAWIYDDSGLRRTVVFEKGDRLAFRPGPHDDVISLQGVKPLRQQIGDLVEYDLQALYESSNLHPLTGRLESNGSASLRLALLRMKSTYPRGEAVDLNVILEPKALPTPQAIRVVQRDTLLFSANLTYVVQEEVVEESPWTAAVMIESGVGQARLNSEIPATQIPEFTDSGYAGTYYIDGTIYLRRGESRWALHGFGLSSINRTRFVSMANHQVALFADARFEHGTENFLIAQLSGEMTDKQHQEFDWNSSDYAAEALAGFGRRFFDKYGFEKSRMEFLVGVRMGENRRIEVLELRGKSRGLGPYAVLAGDLIKPLGPKTSLNAGFQASGYSIFGLGPRDEGFAERGVNVSSDVKVGRAFLGVTVRVGLTAMWWLRRANLVDEMHYLENRVLLAPGVSIETYL